MELFVVQGGYIEVAGKKIYESCLNNEDFQRARSLFEEHHILYNLETTEMTFQSDEMSKEFFKYQLKDGKMNSEMKRLINEQKNMFNIHTLEEFEQNPLPVQKLCFIAHDEKQLEEPKRLLSDQYNFIIHEIFSEETINGEIIIKGTNKGDAIERVVEYLGLSMQDTIGFGDSMNDYEMIKICHQGIVMENGSKELKKYATSICENVQDDGVYKELMRLGLSD